MLGLFYKLLDLYKTRIIKNHIVIGKSAPQI